LTSVNEAAHRMKALTVLQPICCATDAPPLPRDAAADLAATFKALADPTRVAIVNRLSTAGEVCVCDLTAAFELAQPTISHHLRVLRSAGLVEVERRGTWAYYRLVPEAIAALRNVFDAR
jgi:ArsR family transcriptional regulator